MNTLKYFLFAVGSFIFFNSCENKTKNLLAKKWDCVQIDNLAAIDKNFASKEDSVAAVKIEAALKALSWTFTKSNTYQCNSIGGIITAQGSYEISEDEKMLTCTSFTKNAVNTYMITSLSEVELTLTSTATMVPLILHFRPN